MVLKSYISLTKPGIIFGNAVTAIAGFLLAAQWHGTLSLFFAMLVGLCLIIASGCVFNNYLDRKIDAKMARTKKRALVQKAISPRNALVYGTILGLVGIWVLTFTNLLTVVLALTGFFFYVVMYGIGKRKTVHGTVIGSISGAMPIVVGYCAVTNRFDLGAVILFLILVFWQMPHFYAIALYRLNDYASAGLPVLPVKQGIPITKLHILLYTIGFVASSLLLTTFGFAGWIYFIVMGIAGLIWLWLAVQGFMTKAPEQWARKLFRFSLLIILLFCIIIPVDSLLR